MLRAAIVEKSKEHREYIRASLTGINMDIQVSEYADEYDYLDDLNEDASSFDILLLNTTIHREGDGLELAAKVRARSRKVMICFITDSQRYYAEAFSVFATGYLLYPFDVSELHNCITFFLAEADHGAPCLPYAEGGGRKLSPCVLQKYSVCGERQPQGDPASGEWRNHRELRQAGRAGTAASRQIIFPVPSELYYQPLFCGKNGYRQVHSPVCRNSCFPEISARGAGNVL